MDKEHLIDLISNSMLIEIENIDSNNRRSSDRTYLNSLNLNQLRIISKEFIL